MHASTPIKTNKNDESLLRLPINEWSVHDVSFWAKNIERFSGKVLTVVQNEDIDGEVLLELTEDDIRDFRYRLSYGLTLNELKKLWLAVRALQARHIQANGSTPSTTVTNRYLQPPDSSPLHRYAGFPPGTIIATPFISKNCCTDACVGVSRDGYNISPPISVDGRASSIPPEFFKTGISLGYSFLVTWITSFVMVIVHERVPDMKRYPPLPDIFLDNVPHIPWAFSMCEITGTLLFVIWLCVCIFHKYRMVLLRRFFALAGTVFLLRCVTMLITSLSVPGTHLQCNQKDYAIDDLHLSSTEALQLRITRAYIIWSGLGMSIQGVRTCGDYMFSGHTVALTLLNFFITEYTPRHLYFLHTLTWLLNMFGIFFILAAHEHYSIDVFVAFYITSRLFLYYHTLANNQALMSHDSGRTRIWFPMFSYFESSVDGIVPNEYDSLQTIGDGILQLVVGIKDTFMLTARRYWLESSHMQSSSKSFILPQNSKLRNASTSMASNENIPSTSKKTISVDSKDEDERIVSLIPENFGTTGTINSDSDESIHQHRLSVKKDT